MKNKTNTSLIFVSILTLSMVGAFYVTVSYVGGLSEKTNELKTEVESKQIKINHIQNVNKTAEKTSEDSIKIMNHFIPANGAIDFVSVVEGTASNFSLKYNTNSIENVENDMLASQGKQILKISMTLSGNWKNILKFVTYIESLPYAVRVEKFELSTDAPNGGDKIVSKETMWKLSINFSVVKIKEKVGK